MARHQRAIRRLLPAGCLLVLVAHVSAAAVVYVNINCPGPAHDGTSWATADTSVQTALDGAKPGDEVRVASGTYTAVFGFGIPPGVALYGGFSGTETDRTQRSPARNVTILDGNGFSSAVTVPTNATGVVIDGFTIRNGVGQVVGTSTDYSRAGGGIYCNPGSEVVISHNIITDNHIAPSDNVYTFGAGVFCDHTDVTMSHNVIIGNSAENGGALGTWGGAICTFEGTALIDGNVITGNTSKGGPALAIYSQAQISNNLISGNVGGIESAYHTLTIVNNTIAANSLTALLVRTGTFTIANNIVANNSSGLDCYSDAAKTLRNNDVIGNTSFDYRGTADPTGADGNIRQDPLFTDQANGNFHLTAASPCRDSGDDGEIAPGAADQDGNPRKVGTHVDLGAYEYPLPGMFTLPDVVRALHVAAGLDAATSADTPRLNVVSPPGSAIVISDAVRLIRKVAGLDRNP